MKTTLSLMTCCIGLCTIFAQMSINPIIGSIDIDAVLKDSNRRNNLINCLLDQDKCDIITQNIKNMLPNAIKTKCKKCPIQLQRHAVKFMNYMQKNDTENWEKFLEKYDPSGKVVDEFLEHFSDQSE